LAKNRQNFPPNPWLDELCIKIQLFVKMLLTTKEKLIFLSEIPNLGQKATFWLNRMILSKNRNFSQKSIKNKIAIIWPSI